MINFEKIIELYQQKVEELENQKRQSLGLPVETTILEAIKTTGPIDTFTFNQSMCVKLSSYDLISQIINALVESGKLEKNGSILKLKNE